MNKPTKKMKQVIASVAFFATLGAMSRPVLALEPGSADDPIITRSYLEERLAGLTGTTSASISEEMLNFIIKEVTAAMQAPSYVPVNVQNGQVLLGDEGTEIILRGGSGTAHTGVDGLVDMTTGDELLNGDVVSLNHLLIVPRTDGRGVRVNSDEAWFIVRGGFRIEG